MSRTDTPITDQSANSIGNVTLDTPITRGEQVISSVTLRKPKAGELRGIALADLIRMDVGALQAVLPRVTSPALTTADVAGLEPHDLMQLGTEVMGFFMTRAERETLAASRGT